jgi:hypothetical protein
MSTTQVHDWMRPRLARLLADARTAGIPYDVAVAVLIDLATSETFNPPDPGPRAGLTP